MATFNSNIVTAGVPPLFPVPGTVRPVWGSVSIPSGQVFTAEDTINLFQIDGPSCHLVDFVIWVPDLDAATALVLDLQYGFATPTVIVNDSTVGQAGGVLSTVNAIAGTVGSGVTVTTPTYVQFEVVTGATNNASVATIYFVAQVAAD
jgi:hypothetical protein